MVTPPTKRQPPGYVCMPHLIEMWNLGEEVHGLRFFVTADHCELCTGVTVPPLHYGETGWAPEDVRELRPEWTVEHAREWLAENDRRISDRLVELGWAVIEALLD